MPPVNHLGACRLCYFRSQIQVNGLPYLQIKTIYAVNILIEANQIIQMGKETTMTTKFQI